MIFVCNKKNMPTIPKDGIVVNIMRPSILSNDYSHNINSAAKMIVSTRKEAISFYEKDFNINIKRNKPFREEVIRLFKLAKQKHIYLMCACYPKQCHGTIIKNFLILHLGDSIYQNSK